MKVYLGTDEIYKGNLGSNIVDPNGLIKGADPTPPPVVSPIDPATIGGLLIYADASRSNVLVDGSGWVYGVQNLGSLGGNFSVYPDPSVFNPVPLANFRKGSGSRRYFDFSYLANYMTTMYFSYPSGYTPKTTISIARMVYTTGSGARARIWNHDTGPLHPRNLDSTSMDGAIPSYVYGVTPDTALSPYPFTPANTAYSMFAWSSPNYFGSTGSKFQTGLNNSTTATYSSVYGGPDPINRYFVNDWDRVPSPAAISISGTNYHVAHMVYDSVLTEAQINGIYQYFDVTRSYNMV